VIELIRDHSDDYEPSFEEVFDKLADRLNPQPKPDRDTAMVMLHNGVDHITIAMHDQPARKPLQGA
jgi:hypothetical protein